MSLRGVVVRWNDFWFRPEPPTAIGLYRIAYGVLTVANLLMLRRDWLTWYGSHATLRLATLHMLMPGPRVDLLAIWPQSDVAINAFFWIFLVAAVCLTVGWMTRCSSIIVFLCLLSIHDRNPYILNSGDTLMRVAGFFLMCAPAGAAFSVDRLVRLWRGTEGATIPPRAPWAQRMIQLEVSVMYVTTVLAKLGGHLWRNGTALYYVLKVTQFQRFPVPWTDNLFLVRVGTWGTLCIETAAGLLVWVRRFRYPVLLLAACLHMGIEYAMNIPLFEWVVVATYITFIEPDDLARAWRWLLNWIAPHLPSPVTVIYDARASRAAACVRVLRAADILGRVSFVGTRPGAAEVHSDAASVASNQPRPSAEPLAVMTPDGNRHTGPGALAVLASRVPLLWPLALATPMLHTPPAPVTTTPVR